MSLGQNSSLGQPPLSRERTAILGLAGGGIVTITAGLLYTAYANGLVSTFVKWCGEEVDLLKVKLEQNKMKADYKKSIANIEKAEKKQLNDITIDCEKSANEKINKAKEETIEEEEIIKIRLINKMIKGLSFGPDNIISFPRNEAEKYREIFEKYSKCCNTGCIEFLNYNYNKDQKKEFRKNIREEYNRRHN
jgi:hypothetical protein